MNKTNDIYTAICECCKESYYKFQLDEHGVCFACRAEKLADDMKEKLSAMRAGA